MSNTNLVQALILFAGSFILIACNPSDFGKVKPDFSQIKIPASVLNIGKSVNGLKHQDNLITAVDTPLPLQDILEIRWQLETKGTNFLNL